MTGMIVRCDKSGLGIQSRRLVRMIQPDKLMIIDSSIFNGNEQHPEWYSNYDSVGVKGFPTDMQIRSFLSGLDKVISCEIFYSNRFTLIARNMRVKTICIANPEFFDWFKQQWALIPLPNKVIVPSKWMLKEMKQRFNAEYLPTPIFNDEFETVRAANLVGAYSPPHYLFMNGKTAAMDRNGLESLYEALHHAKGNFTVTVKAQHDIKKHPDPRLVYDFSNPEDQQELYKGYDCLILPRRYGGQAMSMCEALLCAMPVVMSKISPNTEVLPEKWLVPATKTGELMTRTMLDVYSADAKALADMLDNIDLSKEAKLKAYEIGKQYEAENLRTRYEELVK